MVNRTDEDLIFLVRQKNAAALKELYRRYEVRIYNFILKYCGRKELAQELLQQTFERIWFAAHLFLPNRGSLKGWMFAIALNLTRNEMSKKRYHYQYQDLAAAAESDPLLFTSYQTGPENAVMQQQTKATISQALGKLEPPLREIILLKHFQQLKFREIAEITRIPESTLKARFQKAISELRTLLKAEDI